MDWRGAVLNHVTPPFASLRADNCVYITRENPAPR